MIMATSPNAKLIYDRALMQEKQNAVATMQSKALRNKHLDELAGRLKSIDAELKAGTANTRRVAKLNEIRANIMQTLINTGRISR